MKTPLRLAILGIDGSGKSRLCATIATTAASRLGAVVLSAGDEYQCCAPDQDLLLPGFAPRGRPVAARAALWFGRLAKALHAVPFYPLVKAAHLATQVVASRQLSSRLGAQVVVTDGDATLTCAARAVNYAPKAGSVDLMGRFERWFGLPDAVVLLDLPAAVALARLDTAGRLDHHENLVDMSAAAAAYRQVVTRFAQTGRRTVVLDAGSLSAAEVLDRVIAVIADLRGDPDQASAPAPAQRLGESDPALARALTLMARYLHPRYLVGHLLRDIRRGSLVELTFPFSRFGKQVLREGYSADVMKTIYAGPRNRPLDRAFLSYPLHRAVADRLGILERLVAAELRDRLAALPEGRSLKVLTAPSGYAYDLRRPLSRLSDDDRHRVEVIACDLDQDGRIEPELDHEGFSFVRGDLTGRAVRERLAVAGPFDLVLFIGLSSWISKPDLLRHLLLVRRLMAPGGTLLVDCFTPDGYSLPGYHAGYRASYYSPTHLTALLELSGISTARTAWAMGIDRINHVARVS